MTSRLVANGSRRRELPLSTGVGLATVALAAYNVVVALFTAEPTRWSTFPFNSGPDAPEVILGLSLVLAGTGATIFMRRIPPWLLGTSILLWSTLGRVLVTPEENAILSVPSAALFAVYLHPRRRLTARSPWARSRRKVSAIYFLSLVLVLTPVGARTLGEHFRPPIRTWTAAFYYVVNTVSLVGYGDIVPATRIGQAVVTGFIALSVASFALAASVLIPYFYQQHFKGFIMELESFENRRLRDHVIVAGTASAVHALVEELRERDTPVLVVDKEGDLESWADHMDVFAFEGDPTNAGVLDKVNVQKARAVIAASDRDTVNAFVLLTAMDLAPDVRRISLVNDPGNMGTLKRAGAQVLINPNKVGGILLGRAALGEVDGDHPL